MSELENHAEASPNPDVKTPQDELEYRLRQQRIAAEFGYVALKTYDLDELLHQGCKSAAEGLGAGFAKFLSHLGGGAGFIVKAGVGWKAGVVGHATVGDDMESPAGYAFHSEQAVISNHLDNEERFRTPALLVEHGIKRALNVIIRCDRKRYGVLEIDSPSEGKFDEADLSFVEALAAMLGVAIQREEREQQLHEAVRHQEMLTQEVSHRVKNSLSIVAGLLNMQARVSDNEDVVSALRDAGHRVQTVASVHDRLWRHNAAHTVDCGTFLAELCDQLQSASRNMIIECRSTSVAIKTEQAVTLGLLVNELVTNAIKYAYADGGTVEVALENINSDHLRLIVSDQGRGLPEDFDAEGRNSLGLRLISSLSKQLGGTPAWKSENGTNFRLEFKPVDDFN